MLNFVALITTLLLLTPVPSMAQDRLHIWISAFIPNVHPSKPSYVRKLPHARDRWIIPGPVGSSCFATDHRSFSASPTVSSRIMSEVVLVVGGGSVSAEEAAGRVFHRADPTSEHNCASGAVIHTATASTSDMHFGTPAIAENTVQIVVNAKAKNPLVPSFGTPTIDYGAHSLGRSPSASSGFVATWARFQRSRHMHR